MHIPYRPRCTKSGGDGEAERDPNYSKNMMHVKPTAIVELVS